ncbi:MAG: acyl carrier protein [Thermodesulfobacteriota bacterium]
MEEKLKSVMANVLGAKSDEINDDSSMQTLMNWDSLKHMELMMAIEDEFEMPELSMDEIVEMTSFSKIKSILKSKGVEI